MLSIKFNDQHITNSPFAVRVERGQEGLVKGSPAKRIDTAGYQVRSHTDTQSHNRFTALWILSWATRMSRYQKKHSPRSDYLPYILSSPFLADHIAQIPLVRFVVVVQHAYNKSEAQTKNPQLMDTAARILAQTPL